jgi:hypothetical protein
MDDMDDKIYTEIRDLVWLDIGEQYPSLFTPKDPQDLTFMEFAGDVAKAICNRYTLTPRPVVR